MKHKSGKPFCRKHRPATTNLLSEALLCFTTNIWMSAQVLREKYYLPKLHRSSPHPDTITFCGNAWREKDGVQCGVDDSIVAAPVSQMAPSAGPSSSSQSATLDSITAGQAFASTAQAPAPLIHKTALQILQSPDEGGRCNFEGVVVVCDEFPRDVQYADASPRKSRAVSMESKTVDAILWTKQVQSACVYGAAAPKLYATVGGKLRSGARVELTAHAVSS